MSITKIVNINELPGYQAVTVGTHTLTVVGKASGHIDATSSPITFNKLASPTNENISNTDYSFDSVQDASGYKVYATNLLGTTILLGDYSEPLGYNITVINSRDIGSGDNSEVYVYDGLSSSGILLTNIGFDSEALNVVQETVVCLSGYLYFENYPGSGGSGQNSQINYVSNGITTLEDNYSSFLFSVLANGTIEVSVCSWCLIKGTKIMLADGSDKNIEDITFDDNILVWNFYEGKFDSAKPMWIMNERKTNKYNLLTFEDGTQLGLVGNGGKEGYHRIYNCLKQLFTHTGTDDTPDGTITFTDKSTNLKLISQEIVNELIEYYNVITDKHYNLFANGILTSCKLSNTYKIDNMKYFGDRIISEEEERAYIDELRKKGAVK